MPIVASGRHGAAKWALRMGVNAAGIIDQIAALPAGRAVPAAAPLTGIVQVAGVEVATTSLTAEQAYRKAWRARKGAGATPLLLLADDPAREGSILALGVADANGPVRSVEAAALVEVLERVSSKPRLEAVREIASELERLDQAGIPGLKLRDLLTFHTLDVRLRHDGDRWKPLVDVTSGIERGADWRSVLTSLGYELERLKHRGHLARHNGRPIAVVHPKADPADFSRLDEESRPPEGVLINDCIAEGAGFGLLAGGSRLRLFQVDPSVGSAVSQYLDLDASALQVDDAPFLGLLGPSYLAEGGFDQLLEDARAFGSVLRKRLDNKIRQSVLPTLGRAFGRWAEKAGKDTTDDAVREDLEHAALAFVFRSIFLLYAESGGHLPMENHSYRQAAVTNLVEEAGETFESLSSRSTSLWDRLALLVKAMRHGNPAWGVPAYNGALFAEDGFVGASTLEAIEVGDPEFATVLIGLGRDEETGAGVDYSTLEIGHLGHIYEGLLSLRLSVAAGPLRYDSRKDSYVAVIDGSVPEFEPGDLLWQTHEGGRKAGGVYYTRTELVNQLIRNAVVPAFKDHLSEVKKLAEKDPKAAAAALFDFAVLDPACGSAHFLVSVVAELSDLVVRFLGEVPLPGVSVMLERLRAGAAPGVAIDDVALIRRLVMKRCVYGIDVSPMGAEIAKLSLWLVSFVPGLSLAYLDRNVLVGNSLIGVALPQSLRPPGIGGQSWFLEDALAEGIRSAAEAVAQVAESDDRTPDEIDASRLADAHARDATNSLQTLFDLWTSEALGLEGARQEVEIHGPAILKGRVNELTSRAGELAAQHRFLHWPLAFPTIFASGRRGFDAVVGNPPWDEVKIEEAFFYGLYRPGFWSLTDDKRKAAVEELLSSRPELQDRYKEALEGSEVYRRYYSTSGEYLPTAGDPDLYKYFCQRYRILVRDRGKLGIVLPRSAFATLGSEGFRGWLFQQNTCERIDFLLNKGRWAFDSEERYTVALVVAERKTPSPDRKVRVAGTASSLEEWEEQSASPGLALPEGAFGVGWVIPLLRNQEEVELLAKIRTGSLFPAGSEGRWACFPVRELDETNDKKLWEGADSGRPLWKGESFDQYDPRGAEARWCPFTEKVKKKIRKPRPGADSSLAAEVPLSERREAVLRELDGARLAYRAITRGTDSRTIRACLVPPKTLLANSGPYLAFVRGGPAERACCLGIMDSLPFDWQSRRFVEVNLNYFILESLMIPGVDDDDFDVISKSAARLSCIDERFADFAESVGVEFGPLEDAEREQLRIEIDARVAKAWALEDKELEVLFSDFTEEAVAPAYRRAFAKRLRELS